MMPDIFSSFDPHSFMATHNMSSMLLISNILIIFILQLSFWTKSTRPSMPSLMLTSLIKDQLFRTLTLHLKGSSSIISTMFITIIMINLIGLNPYTFGLSSHLIFTLTLGLPLWLSFLSSSMTKFPKKTTAHLLPNGAPDWLNPFLILIETTSVMVRPITLSFRLAANMSAGHIVLGLIGMYGSVALLQSPSSASLLTLTSMAYIMFEMAICLIQAYIFCLLLSLYANEHAY